MAAYVEVEDAGDPRLADYRDLRDVQLRQSLEAEHGLFLAEGEKVVRRAVEAGFPVRSFLMAPRWLDGLGDVLAPPTRPATSSPRSWPSRSPASTSTAARWLHCVVRRCPAWTRCWSTRAPWSCCEDIVDHTNVGAILRSAAALGVDAALLSPRCADPLYRRAVKVAMGAVFTLPWTRLPDWYDALPDLSRRGFTTVALTLRDDAVDLEEAVDGLDRVALVLGSEGHGLSERGSSADRRAVIPMRPGVDSLNVACCGGGVRLCGHWPESFPDRSRRP